METEQIKLRGHHLSVLKESYLQHQTGSPWQLGLNYGEEVYQRLLDLFRKLDNNSHLRIQLICSGADHLCEVCLVKKTNLSVLCFDKRSKMLDLKAIEDFGFEPNQAYTFQQLKNKFNQPLR